MGKKLLLVAYCILLCITITFSWLFDIEPNYVQNIVIDFEKNNLFIVNAKIEAKLFMEQNGNDVQVDDSFELDSSLLIPNAVIPFYITISNTGESNTLLTMTLLISVNESDLCLLDMLYVDMVVASDDAGVGTHVYKKLSEAKRIGNTNEYSLPLYSSENKLFVKSGGEDEAVKLKGYLYFDRNADSTYQGKSFKIVSFRLEQ